MQINYLAHVPNEWKTAGFNPLQGAKAALSHAFHP
jgi:hypothetical protein